MNQLNEENNIEIVEKSKPTNDQLNSFIGYDMRVNGPILEIDDNDDQS